MKKELTYLKISVLSSAQSYEHEDVIKKTNY